MSGLQKEMWRENVDAGLSGGQGKWGAADAHDAGLSSGLGKNGVRLMLMMLACLAHWRRGVAADAHYAGLSGWLGKMGCG